MIQGFKFNVNSISDKQIKDEAEEYGWEGYVPFNFIRNLIAAWSHMVNGMQQFACIYSDNLTPYERSFKDFINLFNEAIVYRHAVVNPYDFVFNILKTYGGKVNLRHVESSELSKSDFGIFEGGEMNYDVDLSIIEPEILDLLSINTSLPVNKIGLDDDIKEVLKFYNGLRNLNGDIEEKPIYHRSPMTEYHEIVKTGKHRWVYPTFVYDFSKKNLIVKKPEVERLERRSATILVDISTSTTNYYEYSLLYKGMLVYLYDKFESDINDITLYYFAYNVEKVVRITKKEELSELINTELTPVIDRVGWDGMIHYINSNHNGDSFILLTDGLDSSLNPKNIKNNTWNIISLNYNNNLRDIASFTNGKFIKI